MRIYAEAWERVLQQIDTTKSCWVWTGPTYKKEPSIMVNGYNRRIRRIAASAVLRGDTVGKNVIATCGNPFCIRPTHLKVIDRLGRQ